MAPAHIVQGSRVTMRVQPVRRHVPRARAASRRATISAWPVGLVMSLATVPPSTDDVAIGIDDDGTDGDVSRFAGAIGQEKGFAHGLAILLIH